MCGAQDPPPHLVTSRLQHIAVAVEKQVPPAGNFANREGRSFVLKFPLLNYYTRRCKSTPTGVVAVGGAARLRRHPLFLHCRNRYEPRPSANSVQVSSVRRIGLLESVSGGSTSVGRPETRP